MTMTRRGTRLAITAILIGCFSLAAACTTTKPDAEGGAASVQDAIERYIDGLNHSDYKTIARLIPPNNEAMTEINQLLRTDGGKAIKVTSVDIQSETSPKYARVFITGVWADGAFNDTVDVSKDSDRWHIVLGRNPNLPKGQTTAATERP
jgi:hypothetical protein